MQGLVENTNSLPVHLALTPGEEDNRLRSVLLKRLASTNDPARRS